MIKLSEAKKGLVILARMTPIERSFAWRTHFHEVACDLEPLLKTAARMDCLAFACLVLSKTVKYAISA